MFLLFVKHTDNSTQPDRCFALRCSEYLNLSQEKIWNFELRGNAVNKNECLSLLGVCYYEILFLPKGECVFLKQKQTPPVVADLLSEPWAMITLSHSLLEELVLVTCPRENMKAQFPPLLPISWHADRSWHLSTPQPGSYPCLQNGRFLVCQLSPWAKMALGRLSNAHCLPSAPWLLTAMQISCNCFLHVRDT